VGRQVREGKDEDETAEEAVDDADDPDDFEWRVVRPVYVRDVCVAGRVLMDSKMIVKTMNVSIDSRKQ
jgi:hypothetical protein